MSIAFALEDATMTFGWLFRRHKADVTDGERIEWESTGNGTAKHILGAYPKDYVIYAGFSVVGVAFRFLDASNFVNSQKLSVALQQESTNKHDKTAIKVIGLCQRGRYFIGYVPKNVSAHIARSGMYDVLRPRLVRVYTAPQAPDSDYEHPFLDIQIQLVGPKGRKEEFERAATVAPRKRKAAI